MKTSAPVFAVLLKKLKKDFKGPTCEVFTIGCVSCRMKFIERTLSDLLKEKNLVDVKWIGSKGFVPYFHRFLTKNVGIRCKTFDPSCERCQYWLVYDMLAELAHTALIVGDLDSFLGKPIGFAGHSSIIRKSRS